MAVTCLALTGCSQPLFSGTNTWEGDGAIYVSDRKLSPERSTPPMALTLKPDGTGYAINVPHGRPKFDDNVCIEPTSDDLYTGTVTWRNENRVSFEISFRDSRYTLVSGPEKFHINWNEIRLYNCNPGPEYWRMTATIEMDLR